MNMLRFAARAPRAGAGLLPHQPRAAAACVAARPCADSRAGGKAFSGVRHAPVECLNFKEPA